MRNITVNGRLAADVTRQISKQGNEFINFSIGNNEYGDPKSSDGRPQTQWFRVTSFLPQHVKLAKYLTKGKPIIVSGRYSNRLYKNQKTDQWNISNDIIASDIFFEIGSEHMNDGTDGHREENSAQSISGMESMPQVTSQRMKPMSTASQPTNNAVNTMTAQSVDDDDDLPF